MKYSEVNLGRIFILRLEHGDRIPEVIEEFAKKNMVNSALVHFLGGADINSKVVVGPEDGRELKPQPVITELLGASEAVGIGTIFTNEQGYPVLHMHASFGKGREVICGCTREGVGVWHIGEAVVFELVNSKAQRKIDKITGFELLEL